MAPRKRKPSTAQRVPIFPRHRPIPVNADLANSHPLLHAASWQMASNYIGDDLTGRSVVMMNGNDSVVRANWQVATKRLADLDGIEIHRFNMWSTGRIDTMMVRHDAPPATLDACEAMLQSLVHYPCLDDGALSQIEHDDAVSAWDHWGRDELRSAVRDRDLGYAASYIVDQMTDADLDVRFKQICCEFGLSWFEPIDGDSAQFPIDRVAADLIETLTTAYDSETAAMIERELAEYHRHQICLPGFDGCKPDVELLAPQIMAEREAALYE